MKKNWFSTVVIASVFLALSLNEGVTGTFKCERYQKNLYVDKNVLHKTYKNIYNKKYSQSNNPIECQYTNQGILQVIDGNHRYFEALLTNKEEVDVVITYDERCGYNNPHYQTLDNYDKFEPDFDKIFSGLELEFDEETLSYMYEDYIDEQKKSLLNTVSDNKPINNKRKIKP